MTHQHVVSHVKSRVHEVQTYHVNLISNAKCINKSTVNYATELHRIIHQKNYAVNTDLTFKLISSIRQLTAQQLEWIRQDEGIGDHEIS